VSLTVPQATPDPDGSLPAARKARKTPGRRHENRRLQILRTAAELFAINGYEATSLDMIAEVVGIHKATLYHYIKSKEEVLYQCLISSFEDLEGVIQQIENTSIPVPERLRYFCMQLAKAQNNVFGRCLVLVGSRPLEADASRGIREFQIRLDTTVRQLVAEGVEKGELRACDPAMVSAMLFGTLNWVPRWYRPDGRYSLEQIVDIFLDMLVHGLAPH